MKELIEIYAIIDANLCKNKSLKKIEEILNNNQTFIMLANKDKEHISNYINKQISDTEMKRKLEKNKVTSSSNKIEEKQVKKKSKNIIVSNNEAVTTEAKFCDETKTKSEKELKEEGEKLSSIYKAISLSKITKEEYEKRKAIYEVLEKIVLPEQRSPGWFAMRNGKITASDAGCVVGLNKYEHVYKFVHKKVFGSTFKTNQACYHGKKLDINV